MSSYPFVQTSSVFNTNDYNVLTTGLTLQTANMLYLSLNGGVISGNLNVLNNLNCTTLTVNGLSLNVAAITGVTPGICSASKALIVDSSLNINNINSLTSTTLTASTALILGSTSISETEIGFLDGVTAGTATASKVLSTDSNNYLQGLTRLSVGSVAGTQNLNVLAGSGNNCIIRFGATETVGKCWSMSYFASAGDRLQWDSFGTSGQMILTTAGDLSSKASFDTLAYKLNGVAIAMSALTSITLGSAAASKALTLDASSNITGINSLTTTTLITTNLTIGATAITATGIELNYNTDVVAGTVLASSSVVVDSNKDITGFRRLSVGGTTGIMQINALTGGDSAIRLGSSEAVNKCWTIQYLTAINLLRFDAYGSNSSITLTPAGDLTSKASFDTLAYKLNGVSITMSSLTGITLGLAEANKALTLDASSNITGINSLSTTILNVSGTTGSTSNTTGALTLSGGIGISLTTDATSISNGGSFTTAGGMAIAKSVWCGGTITVNKSTSSSLFAGYSGTSNFTVSGLLNSDITIGTGSSNNLNIMTGNTTAMTINGFTQNISGITSLSANFLTANSLTGTCETAAQPFITSLGVLTSLSVSGTLTLGGTSITSSASEINYLAGVTPGTAIASKAVVVDASKNIATLNSLTSNYLVINTAINSGNCLASFGALNVGPIVTSCGISSIKGTSSYPSVYFGSTNSILWAEGSHASPIEFEIGISSLTKATSTNCARIGTMTLNDLSFNTNAVERMLIRSSGAVAIKNYLQVGDSVDTTRMVSILDNTMTAGTSRYLTLGKQNAIGDQAEMAFLYVSANDDTNALTMGFYGGEKMRLTRYGSLLINSTSNVYSGTKTRLAVEAPGATDWVCCFKNTSAANNKCMGFINNSASEVGSITWGTGTTSFNTTSDYRLKKNIKPLTNCLELINKLKPVRYNWINEYNEPAEGFLAHELQEVFPLIVVGKKDAVYEDGSINPQSIDYSKLTPYLTAAVQDLTKINIALSKKIEDLESKVKNILSYDDLNKHIKLITKQVLKDYTVE